ncbi:hypothetical protein N9L92_01510 [Saprospiraceae bacterium]|nr:hypothetical protein [Saprospiraceae bacterium]
MNYLIACFFLLISLSGFSYPIEPITLNEMIDISPYVAYGQVISNYDTISVKDSERPLTFATVKIEKMLVGYLQEEEVKIFYEAHFICPSPANFKMNKMVTVFFDKKNERYSTTGLSYSTSYIDEENLDIYHQRIIDNARIKDLHKGDEREKLLTDWCIKNLEYEVLKKDACREIRNALSSYKRTKEDMFMYGVNSNTIDIINNWTDAHRQIIKNLVIDDELNIHNVNALELLFSDFEEEFKTYLHRTLTNDIKRKHLYRVKSYMKALFNINMPSEAISIFEEISETPNIYKLNNDKVVLKVQRFLDLISDK